MKNIVEFPNLHKRQKELNKRNKEIEMKEYYLSAKEHELSKREKDIRKSEKVQTGVMWMCYCAGIIAMCAVVAIFRYLSL